MKRTNPKGKKYSTVNASDFATSHPLTRLSVFSAPPLEISGPKFIGTYEFTPIKENKVTLKQPKLDIFHYHNATVIGGTNYTLAEGLLIHPDTYIKSRDICPAESNGIAKVDTKTITLYLPDREERSIEKAISLLGCCTGNYAHWLTETLPKLLVIDTQNEFDHYPLLVDHWIHPNFIDSIKLVRKVERPLIRVKRWEAMKVQSLIDVSPPAYVPPEYRVFIEKQQLPTPTPSDFSFSRIALQLLKDKAYQALELGKPKAKKKLYLYRAKESCGNTRFVENIQEVENLIQSYGYIFLDPARLSFSDQVSVFSTASHVVAPLGAAMANLIFTPIGCRVLGLSPYYENANYYYFSNFMGTLEHDLHYVLGKQTSETGHLLHRKYEIDIDALKLALDSMDTN